MEQNEKIITEQSLSEIKYSDLKKKFEELGVSSAWKPGTKKIEMIKVAIEKLKKIKILQEKGLDKDQVEKALENAEEKKDELKLAEEAKKAKEAEEAEKASFEKLKKKELSKETIEKNLQNIEKNLICCSELHRNILLKKKEELSALLGVYSTEEELVVSKAEN